MSDIQPGDVVECINDTPLPPWKAIGIIKGRRYRVSHFDDDPLFGRLLMLCERPGRTRGFTPSRFRKIDPPMMQIEVCITTKAKE